MIWTKAGMWYMSEFGYAIRKNGDKWWLYKNGTLTIDTGTQAKIFDRLIDAKQAARRLYAREMQGGVK